MENEESLSDTKGDQMGILVKLTEQHSCYNWTLEDNAQGQGLVEKGLRRAYLEFSQRESLYQFP